ncbi:related to Transposon Ty3-G Gag-Pol polyprotein [Saccharomycodes ludwigii]|uniref:RNA-directed DNA polymerase n=1 Tax=Saccharomycodes ludwigii TaxID=36035 RepID=A0A376B9P2_9ASCO|nr:related to Transposon Ty3-G Gag-Pol polyprotein [Saccharomycodes ludwigii]
MYLDLNKMRQTKSVMEYTDKFEKTRLLLPIDFVSEKALIVTFIAGLKKDICRELRIRDPQTLREAEEMAWRADNLGSKTNNVNWYDTPTSTSNDPDAMEIDAMQSKYMNRNSSSGRRNYNNSERWDYNNRNRQIKDYVMNVVIQDTTLLNVQRVKRETRVLPRLRDIELNCLNTQKNRKTIARFTKKEKKQQENYKNNKKLLQKKKKNNNNNYNQSLQRPEPNSIKSLYQGHVEFAYADPEELGKFEQYYNEDEEEVFYDANSQLPATNDTKAEGIETGTDEQLSTAGIEKDTNPIVEIDDRDEVMDRMRERLKERKNSRIYPLIMKTPKIGRRREVELLLNDATLATVLMDTGAPTSVISRNLVEIIGLEVSKAPFQSISGAIKGTKEGTNKATTVRFTINDKEYKIDAYILDTINNKVIVGNPILETNPELLNIETEDKEQLNELLEVTIETKENKTWNFIPEWLRKKFRDIVGTKLLPETHKLVNVHHEIILKDPERLPKMQPYRSTPKLEEEARKMVDSLLSDGYIEESKAPIASPIIMVKKKSGDYRLCVDYRMLNKNTEPDLFPLPLLDTIFAKLGSSKIFTTLDLLNGYYQIPMKKEHKPLTSFVTPFGKYQFTVMPFGLRNAPSTFARLMSDIFRDLKFVCIYLDDILIHSDNTEEHWKHLETVLQRLKDHGLVAKRSKCYFAQRKVVFLGHEISSDGIRPLQGKTDAIKNLIVTQDIKSVQRFLGMINFYRRFIPRCSHIAKPLVEFTAKKTEWSDEQTQSVETLKKALGSPPILVPYTPKCYMRLTTDASYDGLGAVLEKLENNKLIGVIGYFSKSLQGAQKNYPPGELELLAIIEALNHFRYLLHGNHFELRTDHISLLSLQNKKEPSRRISRWLDMLSEYDFTLTYLKGTMNHIADTLSRDSKSLEVDTIDAKSWLELYENDPWCAAVLHGMKHIDNVNTEGMDLHLFKKYQKKWTSSRQFQEAYTIDKDNFLYYKDRLCVPQKARNSVLEYYHDNAILGGHFGADITFHKIAKDYYWPSLYSNIQDYVAHCYNCQVMKQHRRASQGLLQSLDVPKGRWSHITIDFASGLPLTFRQNDFILIVVDRFSKRCHFIPCKSTTGSIELINLLFKHVFAYHGFPRFITSDKDIRMMSTAYKELVKRLGIQLKMSSSNHPQTDGQTERVIQVLGRMLKSYCSVHHQQWDNFLPILEFCYNSTYLSSIRAAPFEVDLGYIPNKPQIFTEGESSAQNDSAVELAKKLKAIELRTKDFLAANAENNEVAKNNKRIQIILEPGQHVLVHRDAYFVKGKYWKIQPIYLGPFKVVKKINDNAYEIDLPSTKKTHRVINIEWLKEFKHDPDRYPKHPPRTEKEMEFRLTEIVSVIGITEDKTKLYAKFSDVDPTLSVEIPLRIFNKLPDYRKTALLANFKQLWKHSVSEEEDVVI